MLGRRVIPWLWCGGLLVSGLLPDALTKLVEFNRTAINQGEFWRIVTSQWVHFGFNHSLMNGLCFAIVQFRLLKDLPLRRWLITQLVVQLGVGCGLYFTLGDGEIYRGYSGAFCGLLAFGLLWNLSRDTWFLAVVYAGLLLKIAVEQTPGYNLDYLKNVMDFSVAVDAHLFGVITGSLWAGVCRGLAWHAGRRPAAARSE